MIHPRSSSLISSRRQPTRWNAFCTTTNSTTILKRTRAVCIMSNMPIVLIGLLLWCSSHHSHTMTITYGVMAFSTNRWISPPLSTAKGTVSLLLSPSVPSSRNMYDTALHQETRRRHATTTTTTTLAMGTTSTTTSAASTSRMKKHVATSPSKTLKFIPVTTTTSRLLRRRQKQIQKTIRNMNSDLLQLIDSITNTVTTNVPALLFDRIYDILYTCIIPFWYLLPSILCFVPIYTLTVWQTIPVTPDVWKLVNMDFIWWYYTHKPHAISVIFTFLASNASFFMAALFLLKQSNPVVTTITPQQIQKTSSSTSSTVSSTATAIAAATAVLNRGKAIPSSLGYWVLAAGIMSTIFHTVQACGNYRIAEALCYLDHGIAGTAICHFYNRCGTPSLRTILCGIIAFITLAFPITSIHLPSYTTLHSLWHTLAAATAVLWAYDATHAPSSKQKPLVE
jgi:hypothetical protein